MKFALSSDCTSLVSPSKSLVGLTAMVATPLLRNCNDMKLYLFLSKKNIGIGCVKGIKKGRLKFSDGLF